jgi:CarboxypepD_reg-like domain
MKKIVSLFALIISINFCFSQIKGRCVDEKGKPILYANVGLVDSPMGTVTNADGEFVIDGEFVATKFTIIVSCMGYLTKSMDVDSDKKTAIEVVMQPAIYELDEVKIATSNYKFTEEKRIGNKTLSNNISVGFESKYMGAEVGRYFKVKKGKKYKVEKLHFKIATLGCKKATFRINFYKALDQDNIDSERYNYEDIIMEISKTGEVSVDLKDYKIVFENGFLVTIERLEQIDVIGQDKVMFNSNVFCGPFYIRVKHFDKWKTDRLKYNIGLGMQLFVKQ